MKLSTLLLGDYEILSAIKMFFLPYKEETIVATWVLLLVQQSLDLFGES